MDSALLGSFPGIKATGDQQGFRLMKTSVNALDNRTSARCASNREPDYRMEKMEQSRVLIVDDDRSLCDMIKDFIRAWQMEALVATDADEVPGLIDEYPCDIVLLDLIMRRQNVLALIPEIKSHCPDARIIIMSGYADKDTAISALKAGAFDFLEKPIESALLRHSISRALEDQKKERENVRLLESLKLSQVELMTQKERLEFLNKQFLDTNRALSVLAQNMDHEREEMENRIASRLRSLVIPSLERLARDKNLAGYKAELDALISQVEDITSDFILDKRIASLLSFTELRIASLIKNGLSTEEIAGQLHISPATVRTHRKNIRSKLKIKNTQHSLRNFLLVRKE